MSRRITVHGRFQGVWYRGWTVAQARALGLDGWVRNRRDGTVEIVADGPEEAIAELVRRCRSGPPEARVEAVTAESDDEAVPPGFAQRASL